MGYVLNPNNFDFKNWSLVKTPKFYVDKTDFIAYLNQNIHSDDKFICFTRPRRFGKTITAKMLSAYYSKGCDSKELFDRFKISSDSSYTEHLNKYNVIYIDMNGIYEEFLRTKKTEIVQDIVDYLLYKIVKELRSEKIFFDVIENNSDLNEISLTQSISEIYIQTREQFVFIMDEWDLIYREFRDDDKLQRKFIDLLRGLFKNTYCQQAFALVYLTGILPIKKYKSESALNNFREYNMLRPKPYARFFGFTEEETELIAKEHNNTPSITELKEWYDGYDLNGTSILNPNSVACAISDGECQSYWTNTAAITPLLNLVKYDLIGFKEDLIKILAGGKVVFNTKSFQNDMVSIQNKDDAFCLLVCLGYAACIKNPDNTDELLAYIPNREISIVVKSIISQEDWFPQMEMIQRSDELYNATIRLDVNKVAKIIGDIHNSTYVSNLTYNTEAALSYCVIFGYAGALIKKYNVYRELEAGKGFIDIACVPFNRLDPVLIIELKYDITADAALSQIRSKQYAKDLALSYPNVLLVAINYNSKTKEHECAIENYQCK